MYRYVLWVFVLFVCFSAGESRAQLQSGSPEEGWKHLLEHDGVTFSYVFYREANNTHNGVVVMVANANGYPIGYRFRIVFRSGETEHVEDVSGELRPGQRETGDKAGLFWIPFDDDRPITEIGLRNFRIERREDAGAV